MNAQKARMNGSESLKSQNKWKWKFKMPKWKEVRVQKGKIKGDQAQDARKWKKLQNGPGRGAPKSYLKISRKWTVFRNLCGWPTDQIGKKTKWKAMKEAKMERNDGPKGQYKRKWRSNRPKSKRMKAQKAKIKGN